MPAELTNLAASAATPNALETLGINWKLFLAQLVNVGIILIVLRTWVFKPLGTLLEERRKKIEDGLKHAEEADKRLVNAKQQEDSLVSAARAEGLKIVDQLKKTGEQERVAQVEKAKADIDLQMEDAKSKIQAERRNALEAVRREVAELVMAATRKVSADGLDEKAHRATVERAISELESEA